MADNRNIDEIAKEITAQYMAQTASDADAQPEEHLEQLKENKRLFRNKAILWAAAGLVMTAMLVYLGVAWYTRIANTHAVTFDVADYELAVNDNTDNEFIVNVYNYRNIDQGTNTKKEENAAPGTYGYIPLRMSARHGEINVDYSIVVKNLMHPDLREHIRFFYLVSNDSNETPVVCSLEYKNGSATPTIVAADRDKFMSTPDTLPRNTKKKYIPAQETSGNASQFTIEGTVEMTTEKMIYIYWEWYLDAEDAAADTAAGNSQAGLVASWNALNPTNTVANFEALKTAWDALDTDVGRYPAKYDEAMIVHLTCVGVQSEPMLDQNQATQ